MTEEGLRQRIEKLKIEKPLTTEDIAWNNAVWRIGEELNRTIADTRKPCKLCVGDCIALNCNRYYFLKALSSEEAKT